MTIPCSHFPWNHCHRCAPPKHGSPLRRFLRAEKAAANAQTYPEVCRAWRLALGSLYTGIGGRYWIKRE